MHTKSIVGGTNDLGLINIFIDITQAFVNMLTPPTVPYSMYATEHDFLPTQDLLISPHHALYGPIGCYKDVDILVIHDDLEEEIAKDDAEEEDEEDVYSRSEPQKKKQKTGGKGLSSFLEGQLGASANYRSLITITSGVEAELDERIDTVMDDIGLDNFEMIGDEVEDDWEEDLRSFLVGVDAWDYEDESDVCTVDIITRGGGKNSKGARTFQRLRENHPRSLQGFQDGEEAAKEDKEQGAQGVRCSLDRQRRRLGRGRKGEGTQ